MAGLQASTPLIKQALIFIIYYEYAYTKYFKGLNCTGCLCFTFYVRYSHLMFCRDYNQNNYFHCLLKCTICTSKNMIAIMHSYFKTSQLPYSFLFLKQIWQLLVHTVSIHIHLNLRFTFYEIFHFHFNVLASPPSRIMLGCHFRSVTITFEVISFFPFSY